MSIEVKIPSIGESISEVQIAEWLKKDGEEVKKDENVAVIDSEKTTLELPAPDSGRLKILHQSGETVHIGEIVARIESGNGTAESKPAAPVSPTEPKPEKPVEKPVPASGAKTSSSETVTDMGAPSRSAKPVAKEAIAKQPADKEAAGSGEAKPAAPEPEKRAPAPGNEPQTKPEGEAVKDKLKRPTQSGPAEKIVPMTMLRRTVARRLVEARQEMAMLTTFNEVDMSAIQALRKEQQEHFEKRHQVKLGFMSFFVKAVTGTLRQFPQLNAEIRGNDIVYHARFDIGVAIASDRGLVVPVLREADRMSFAEIEKAIADYAKRAREGALKPAELTGGTFTITNGGVFGSLLSTPIINPPQTGILGMHTIQERPVAIGGQVVIRPMMFIALTYDHRLVDGREAVLFLHGVKEGIDSPARMLIGI